mgnify:CR=1 FL=1
MNHRITHHFSEQLQQHHIDVTDVMLEQFETYYQELISWNERMNLTGITEREQVYMKHFFDSASLAFFLDMPAFRSVADIGSGAGFPSIPLKILFPHLQVTIIDSLNKRIQFLNHLISALGLKYVDAVHARAEEAGRLAHHREKYDLVTARAVARLNVLNEFCLPFAKVGGYFAAMKGTNPQEEIDAALYSTNLLGGKMQQVHAFRLPIDQSERHIIVIEKVKQTPKAYPRKPGMPLKQPLVKP